MIEAALVKMLQADNVRMRKAGGELAEAAVRVIHDYDGLHRLSIAVAAWSTAIANEGGRPHRDSRLMPDRGETGTGSIGEADESGGARSAIAQPSAKAEP